MDSIATCAERLLLRSDHPALRLSELLESVAEAVDRTLDVRRLRSILESHPDRFRVLEPWKGAWQAPDEAVAPGHDTWVVSVSPPELPPDGAAPALVGLRESVRWLARGVDPRSRTDVSRWYAIAVSERAVRSSLERPAA